MKPVILFRPDNVTMDEFDIAKKYFTVYASRSTIPKNSLVIPRYSALPYYKEMEIDITNYGSKLINTSSQFNYIANFGYYDLIKAFTFKTYFSPMELVEGSYIVKGVTNSRKHQWNTLCFAENKKRAIEIFNELSYDPLIGQQQIIFREYHKLKTFEYLINGLPITNEWRFFFYKNIELSHGYYWSNSLKPELGKLDDQALQLVQMVANRIGIINNFYTIDIAQLENGAWIVVELNSGEMSGLSLNNPDEMYKKLSDQFK